MENPFYGIIVYSILPNFTLNGIWTNSDCRKILLPEIAIKLDSSQTLAGKYSCQYTDEKESVIKANLEIKQDGSIFEFIWTDKKEKETFKGIGIWYAQNTISVGYTML